MQEYLEQNLWKSFLEVSIWLIRSKCLKNLARVISGPDLLLDNPQEELEKRDDGENIDDFVIEERATDDKLKKTRIN